MRFLVYTPVSEDALQQKLGTAEYSYFFVMKGFVRVLAELGEIVPIADPQTEADPIYRAALAEGEDCRLFCFCPPNRAPVGLEVPTTVVLAWEFADLPCYTWDDEPRNDWRNVLADHGNLITLSRQSAGVVKATMGDDFPVAAIPVPVFDIFNRGQRGHSPTIPGTTEIHFQGRMIDSREVDYVDDSVELTDPLAFCSQTFDGNPRRFDFASSSSEPQYLLGFYDPEDWGSWSRTATPSVMLPFAIQGKIKLSLMAVGQGYNVGRQITVSAGGASQTITLLAQPKKYEFTLNVQRPTNLINFSGLDARSYPGTMDVRTLGMGILSLSLRQAGLLRALRKPTSDPAAQPPEPPQTLRLSGVVYTSVLNPQDGRKNWHDIVSAFIHAHRDHPDATLVLKMSHHSVASFVGDILTDLRVNGEARCRVVAIHGYLPDEDLAALIASTSFYVNASKGEGLCLPLMEFMSDGVPAVAPDHTAMADYIDASSTFVVESCPIPTAWPNDPLRRVNTLYARIDWESLMQQFRASYEVATTDPARYEQMSRAAIQTQRTYSADSVVAQKLADFLSSVSPAALAGQS
ncbi:MAG: glycosyltransferase [Actinobacteria bacterium]|nr:MAG: glycosyltransferase [Actinomycetota bacterium]